MNAKAIARLGIPGSLVARAGVMVGEARRAGVTADDARRILTGIVAAPGRDIPSASVTAAIVDAVPIVMHVPADRAMPSSSCRQTHASRQPAWRCAQYFHTSVPLPSRSVRWRPASMGPAGRKIAGRSAEIAPMRSPGTVLSQPPMSTAPSTGWLRSTSSASSASRLR